MNETRPSTPALGCLAASFRRASRALTQHYDDALRPLGLRVTQFTLLQALARAGEVSQGTLGHILAMDSTTLTRTLAVLSGRGWVAKRAGTDGRERRLNLTRAGKAQLRRALPRWERVQARLRRRFGPKRWNHFLRFTNTITTAVGE